MLLAHIATILLFIAVFTLVVFIYVTIGFLVDYILHTDSAIVVAFWPCVPLLYSIVFAEKLSLRILSIKRPCKKCLFNGSSCLSKKGVTCKEWMRKE